jgi:outer membrane protein assembly factor BamA
MKYLEISKPFSIGSRNDGDSCEIVFHLNELPSTRFDGIGGFINNDQRTDFYGNISLEFGDILGTGRSFKINWKKKDKYSNNLRIGYLEPYFPSDNLDLALEFYQEDKDSLFIRSGGRVGIFSRFSNRLSGNVWFSLDRIESENNSFVPSSNIKAVTLEFDYNNTDNRLNPKRGYEFKSGIAYKYRSNKEADLENDLPTQITSLGLSSKYYLKTKENLISVVGFDNWGIITENENITPDEYRYIGGFELLRGYTEARFPAYRYFIGTIEQRVITGKYSRAYLFGDFGLIANSPRSENYNFYPGYGLGIQVPTVPGTFKLEIAWGKTGFPDNLVLNFGFLSDF